MDIAENLSDNLSNGVEESLLSEVFNVPIIILSKTNHHLNQIILIVSNAEVEADKNIKTIKSSFQPAYGIRHPRTFMTILGGGLSIKISVLGGSFQSGRDKNMVAESLR